MLIFYMMEFIGKVQYRSSVGRTGPPGESEILRLNPQRKTKILDATGWNYLEPGSLNLEVAEHVVDALINFTPLITEDGNEIKYPSPYENIPVKRKGYYYYTGIAQKDGITQDVLIRRAINPIRTRIELFAPINLKNIFDLNSNAEVRVYITSIEIN